VRTICNMRLSLAGLALVAATLLMGAPAQAHQATAGCRLFADMPAPPSHGSRPAELFAWGEVHCASTTRVGVSVCAMRLGPAWDVSAPKPIWCRRTFITAPAGGKAFVRTLPHACTVGARYVSFVTLNGLTTDSGPWSTCRADS
jgi:hypothetical protein